MAEQQHRRAQDCAGGNEQEGKRQRQNSRDAASNTTSG